MRSSAAQDTFSSGDVVSAISLGVHTNQNYVLSVLFMPCLNGAFRNE